MLLLDGRDVRHLRRTRRLLNLCALPVLTGARTRSLGPENPDGAKGGGGRAIDGLGASAARELGQGWKVSPCIAVAAGRRVTIADVEGPGVIRHIWLTLFPQHWSTTVLRFHWDGASDPAIEVPLGDFFCQGFGEHCDVQSIPVAANPRGGLNCYWPMPFRERATVTVENRGAEDVPALFYELTYSLEDVATDVGYLHAQWRRSAPVPFKEPHVVLERVAGPGHYVGTYLAWGARADGWWGEGEVKFYVDGDEEWPTICGTGTEDYVGGAWGFAAPDGEYATYTGPFLGFPQALGPDGAYRGRFGLYRWHVPDPIRFEQDLRVTVQALGYGTREDGSGRYVPLEDDVSSTAFWYSAASA